MARYNAPMSEIGAEYAPELATTLSGKHNSRGFDEGDDMKIGTTLPAEPGQPVPIGGESCLMIMAVLYLLVRYMILTINRI